MAYDLGPKVIFTIAAVVALESIILEAADAQTIVEGIIGVFFVVTPMVLQIFVGLSYAVRYIKEKVLVDFRKRKELISLYLDETGDNDTEDIKKQTNPIDGGVTYGGT
jgi:hypothetical protein